MKRESGFTLIEFLIAIILSLLVLECLFLLFVTTKKSTSAQTELLEIKHNAQLAASIMQANIKKAGYIGCAYLIDSFPIVSHVPLYQVSPYTIISGTDHDIKIMHAEVPAANLFAMDEDHQTLKLTKNINFNKDDIIVISDCFHAELAKIKFKKLFLNYQLATLETPLQFDYAADAEISHLVVNHYFTAKTKRKHMDGSPVFALYVQGIKLQKTEIAENIKLMNIIYSEKTNNIVEDKTFSQIEHWENIRGVQVEYQLDAGRFKKNWYMAAAIGK